MFVCRLAVNLQTGPRPHEYVYNHGTVSRNTLKTWCMRHSIGFVDLHNYICATSVNKSLLLREFPVKPISGIEQLTQPMDPEKKCLNFIFPTKYVIRKSLKFSHWPSKKKTGSIFLLLWYQGTSNSGFLTCQPRSIKAWFFCKWTWNWTGRSYSDLPATHNLMEVFGGRMVVASMRYPKQRNIKNIQNIQKFVLIFWLTAANVLDEILINIVFILLYCIPFGFKWLNVTPQS